MKLHFKSETVRKATGWSSLVLGFLVLSQVIPPWFWLGLIGVVLIYGGSLVLWWKRWFD